MEWTYRILPNAEAWLTVIVIGAVFLTLVLSTLPADFVFMGGLGLLLACGVLDVRDGLEGFSSPGLVTVGVLYVVVSGLQETGGLSWISAHVLGLPKSGAGAQLRMMIPVAGLSAFLNNTPVVALFIPVISEWARRIRIQPSQLFIPLSYASIFGGICTLIGTSTNLVVNGMVQSRYGGRGLPLFEITKLGLPCALVGITYVMLAGRRFLPNRRSLESVFKNPREYTLEMRVAKDSPLVGRCIDAAGLRHLPGLFLAELMRGGQILSAVAPDEILCENDRLVFVGNIESVRTAYNLKGLVPATDQLFTLDAPRHERCLVEAVVSNTCPLVGKTIRDGQFRRHYNAVVIAVARNGERLCGKIGDMVLRPGDTLLVESHAGFIPRQRDSRDFYLVSAVEDSTPRRFEKAPLAFLVLLLMVAGAASGRISMLNAALIAAGMMLLLRCCTPSQARRSVEWHVLIVIAAALGLGKALESTGAAASIAGSLLGLTGSNPWMTLALVYAVTALFTEVITNNAAAALIFPIAMNTAERLGVNPMAFIICIMVAASASFASPIGYQTNLMVYGPGGYRFGDYFRFGAPLGMLVGVVAVTLAPLIWPF